MPLPWTPTHKNRTGLSRTSVVVALATVVGCGGLVAAAYLLKRQPRVESQQRDTSDDEIVALQEAFKRYAENQLDFIDLLPDARAYTRKYPDSVSGHILHAQVLMQLEFYGEAYPALTQALGGNPDNFELQKLTGACAAKLERWDEAEAHLLTADALKADDSTVVLQLGNVFLQTGRLDEAEARFQRAKKISGTTPPHKAFAGLAEIQALRGDLGGAIATMGRAIDFAGNDSEAQLWVYRLKRVRFQFDAGLWDEGALALRQTQRDDPESVYTVPCTRLRARLNGQRGEPGKAARDYELLVSGILDPGTLSDSDLAEVYAEIAHWHLEAGNPDRAAQAVRELERRAPQHPRLAELQARL